MKTARDVEVFKTVVRGQPRVFDFAHRIPIGAQCSCPNVPNAVRFANFEGNQCTMEGGALVCAQVNEDRRGNGTLHKCVIPYKTPVIEPTASMIPQCREYRLAATA